MPKGNVLVVTLQDAPDLGPSAPIFTALCEDLVKQGCDVTVITGVPNYDVNEIDPKYRGKLFFEEERNGVRLIRTYVYLVPKKALWGRLLYHGSFNVLATLAELRLKKPDIILADAPILWSGLPLFIGSVFRRVPFIYIIHDIYPDVLSRLGYLNNPLALKIIGEFEKFYYRRARKVTVISEGFRQNLLSKGVPDEKITIIPITADVDFIQPLPRENGLRKEWGLQGKFVVLYAGNMGLSQGLEVVLDAASQLKDCPEIQFVLVGEGATRPDLEARAAQAHLDNVRFFPFKPREEVPQVYAAADVSLVCLKPEIVVESVPSKTYTIMASQRPIIAAVDASSEVGRLLDQVQCGWATPPGDANALAQAILRLYRDKDQQDIMGENGRRYVVENYSRQMSSEKYRALIQESLVNHHT
jgi:colanic acid biosynthesis glycosyl transferase WcaI